MVFGRKNVRVSLTPEQRAQLVDAYRKVIPEVDDLIDRASWFLTEPQVTDVPQDYIVPLRNTLELAHSNRALALSRIESIPTASLDLTALGHEMKAMHDATLRANDLFMRVGTDAAAGVLLKGLLDNSAQ